MPTTIRYPVRVQSRERLVEQIRFRILRDGVVTLGVKYVRISRSFNAASMLNFGAAADDGEFTGYLKVSAQVLLDQQDWMLTVMDTTPPERVYAQKLSMPGSGTYTINILTGSGSEATDPGQVSALARVSGAPASREIVVVERKLDGDWRVAGNGATDAAGEIVLDVDVVGGALYALGLDDFGAPFTPGLSVPAGRRIRPSSFAGVLYEITEAGVLPAAEPEWWPITTEGSRELGTARAVAVRYFQPVGHGPITVEMI
jgi:hypothetical protein